MTNERRVRHTPLLGATTCFFNVCARLGRRMSASRVRAFTTGFSGQSFVFHFSYPARPKVGHEFSSLRAFHADDVFDALSSGLCSAFRVYRFPSLFTNEKIFDANFSTVSTYRNLFVERS